MNVIYYLPRTIKIIIVSYFGGFRLKKMFLVFNKEKIYAYVVSIMTIVTIFFLSSLINSDVNETELTSSNSTETNTIGEAISTSNPSEENVDTKEKNEDNEENVIVNIIESDEIAN